jgi:hypothetical protein
MRARVRVCVSVGVGVLRVRACVRVGVCVCACVGVGVGACGLCTYACVHVYVCVHVCVCVHVMGMAYSTMFVGEFVSICMAYGIAYSWHIGYSIWRHIAPSSWVTCSNPVLTCLCARAGPASVHACREENEDSCAYFYIYKNTYHINMHAYVHTCIYVT